MRTVLASYYIFFLGGMIFFIIGLYMKMTKTTSGVGMIHYEYGASPTTERINGNGALILAGFIFLFTILFRLWYQYLKKKDALTVAEKP